MPDNDTIQVKRKIMKYFNASMVTLLIAGTTFSGCAKKSAPESVVTKAQITGEKTIKSAPQATVAEPTNNATSQNAIKLTPAQSKLTAPNGGDLSLIDTASDKINLSETPNKEVICTVNDVPITAGDFRVKFKIAKAQLENRLAGDPAAEAQLLAEAKRQGMTLTEQEKNQIIQSTNKLKPDTIKLLHNYFPDKNISDEAYKKQVLDLSLALNYAGMEIKKVLLSQMVDAELLSQAAKAKGYTKKAMDNYFETKRSPFYQQLISRLDLTDSEAKNEIVNKKLVSMQITDLQNNVPQPSQTELQKIYNDHKDKLKHGELIRLSHILIAAAADNKPGAQVSRKKQAQALLERAKKGEDFSKLANDYSDDPDTKAAHNGGDLGFKDRNDLEPVFVAKVDNLQVGQVCPQLIESKFGYHIIKITGKKAAGVFSFAEVANELKLGLAEGRQQAAVGSWLQAQRKTAKVRLSPQFQKIVASK